MLSKDLLNSIIGKEDLSIKTGVLDPISELIDLQQSGSFEDCVKLACQKFHERFHHSIKNLLHDFPEDKIDMRGKLFWSGTKRAPVPIQLDSENDLHLSFISSCANLYALQVGIPQSRDKSEIQSIISNIKLKEFVPYNKKINLTNEEEKEAQQKEDEIHDILLRNLKERAQECPKDSIRVTKGDVSDDTNFNFEFIFSASRLCFMIDIKIFNFQLREFIKFLNLIIPNQNNPFSCYSILYNTANLRAMNYRLGK